MLRGIFLHLILKYLHRLHSFIIKIFKIIVEGKSFKVLFYFLERVFVYFYEHTTVDIFYIIFYIVFNFKYFVDIFVIFLDFIFNPFFMNDKTCDWMVICGQICIDLF